MPSRDWNDESGLSDLLGQQVGRYLIRQQIGSGGAANVYQAYDQVLGKSVALKILPPGADESAFSRFQREALTAGSLHHPHIVRVLQVGAASRGNVAYIAMDLVEGISLADLLAQRGQLRPEESCNLLEPVASALAFAHEADIVHRDVKPSNVLLRHASPGAPNSVQLESLDHPVVPLLSDFGIARALDAPELTSVGRTVGTPAYMAPEQCAGRRELDGRADIYSLGAVLYRSVAGRPPFAGSTTQLLHAHVYEPLTIDDAVLRRISPLLVEILQRCMAKQPEDRYATAAALAADLALAAGRSVADRPAAAAAIDNAATSTATLTLTSLPAASAPKTAPTSSTVLVPAPVPVQRKSATTGPASETRLDPSPHGGAVLVPPSPRRNSAWLASGLGAIAVLLLAVAVALIVSARSSGSERRDNAVAVNGGTATPQLAVLAQPPATSEQPASDTPTPPPSPTLSAPNPTATAPPSPTATPDRSKVIDVQPVLTVPPAVPDAPPPSDQPGPPDPNAQVVVSACPNTIAPIFRGALSGLSEAERIKFRCPSGDVVRTDATLLPFERGLLLRLDETPLIYVYYRDTQEWEQIADTWQDGEPPPSSGIVPPSSDLYVPERFFGKVWSDEQRRAALGFATAPTPRRFPTLAQSFPGGLLVANMDDGAVYRFLRIKLRL